MVMRATENVVRREVDIGGYDPQKMTADERLDELAGLLAVGLLRLQRQGEEQRRFRGDFPLAGCDRKRPHGAELIGGR